MHKEKMSPFFPVRLDAIKQRVAGGNIPQSVGVVNIPYASLAAILFLL